MPSYVYHPNLIDEDHSDDPRWDGAAFVNGQTKAAGEQSASVRTGQIVPIPRRFPVRAAQPSPCRRRGS